MANNLYIAAQFSFRNFNDDDMNHIQFTYPRSLASEHISYKVT